MNLRTELFCALATAPEWHEWLKAAAPALQAELLAALRAGAGCAANRTLMLAHLRRLEAGGHGEAAYAFLRERFPFVLAGPPAVAEVFPNFVPGVRTWPRRAVHVGGDLAGLAVRLREGKPRFDFLIQGGKLYVEYLEAGDPSPSEADWLLPKWRRRSTP